MAFTFLLHASNQGVSGCTITLGNTGTGSTNLIVLAKTSFNIVGTDTISDNMGNGAPIALTEHGGGSQYESQLYYYLNPAVGAGHTVTIASSYACGFAGETFSGAASSQTILENGAGGLSGTSFATGAVTPNSANNLIVATAGGGDSPTFATPITASNSYNITDQLSAASDPANGIVMAYLIQSGGPGSTSTIFTVSGANVTGAATSIATFEPSASGSNQTYTTVAGALTLTGYASQKADAYRGVVGALTMAGSAPPKTDAFGGVAGALSLTGYAAQLVNEITISKGTLTLTGYAGSMSQGIQFTLVAGSLVLAGGTIKKIDSLALPAGALSFTGYTPGLGGVPINLTLVGGQLALVGKAVILSQQRIALRKGYPPVPEFMPDDKEHRRQIARRINTLAQGKMNVTNTVTLRASQTTTTLTDARIGQTSAIVPAAALTADGAAAIVAGIWVSNILSGSCTINHASNAAIDQTILFLIIG